MKRASVESLQRPQSATYATVGIAEVPLQHTNLVGVERVELMGVANSGLDMNDDGENGGERREEHNCSVCVYMVRARIREAVDES